VALKTCSKGHRFDKTSDCPVCPICEAADKPGSGFLADLGAPARRALEREGAVTLARLAEYSEREILHLHGIGPSALPKLRKALQDAGLAFKAQG
jgi:hypothetical protein